MSPPEMANNYNADNITGDTRGRLIFAYYDDRGELKLKQLFEDDGDRTLDEILFILSNMQLSDNNGRYTPSRTNDLFADDDEEVNSFNNNGSPSRRSPTRSNRSFNRNGNRTILNNNSTVGSPVSMPVNNGRVSPRRNGSPTRSNGLNNRGNSIGTVNQTRSNGLNNRGNGTTSPRRNGSLTRSNGLNNRGNGTTSPRRNGSLTRSNGMNNRVNNGGFDTDDYDIDGLPIPEDGIGFNSGGSINNGNPRAYSLTFSDDGVSLDPTS